MNEYEYNLEALLRIFTEHSETFEQIYLQQLERHKAQDPDVDWKVDNFNICKALLTICREIEELKRRCN